MSSDTKHRVATPEEVPYKDKASESVERERIAAGLLPAYPATGSDVGDEQVFQYDDSRKLGITSSVFLILNKMIGTGSM